MYVDNRHDCLSALHWYWPQYLCRKYVDIRLFACDIHFHSDQESLCVCLCWQIINECSHMAGMPNPDFCVCLCKPSCSPAFIVFLSSFLQWCWCNVGSIRSICLLTGMNTDSWQHKCACVLQRASLYILFFYIYIYIFLLKPD